jgi:ribosomal protein S18 acetylase RimI-like enzyme
MIVPFRVCQLSPAHLRKYMKLYIAISSDVSPWTPENFLLELPGKWDLSFSLWLEFPTAYCVMSLKEGGVHIHQFMVAPDSRSSGIGSKMLSHAVELARQRSDLITLKVAQDNEKAVRFYLRHGFSRRAIERGYISLSRNL